MREGDRVRVGSLEAQVIETPGHTAGHISYFLPADKLAFVGDTLFSIGCGRVIEGNPEMMWNSLLKLRALPDDTRIVVDAGTGIALTIAAGGIIFLGVVPGIMLDFAHAATQLLAH